MIQYAAALVSYFSGSDYWIPAFAGMTAAILNRHCRFYATA
jgi:hypothetical protein